MAGLLRPVRGGWIALKGLEGRALGPRGRATALVGSVVIGLLAAYMGLLAWVAIAIVSEDVSDPDWVDLLWVAAFGLPPVTIAAGLVAAAALLAAAGLKGGVPSFLTTAVKLVLALAGLWVLCVFTIALGIAIESATGDGY